MRVSSRAATTRVMRRNKTQTSLHENLQRQSVLCRSQQRSITKGSKIGGRKIEAQIVRQDSEVLKLGVITVKQPKVKGSQGIQDFISRDRANIGDALPQGNEKKGKDPDPMKSENLIKEVVLVDSTYKDHRKGR